MQVPNIQHPFNFLAVFSFVTGFPTSLVLLFSGLFLIQALNLLSNQHGGYFMLFLPLVLQTPQLLRSVLCPG